MVATVTVADPAQGELIEFDLQRLWTQARPNYYGGGGGIESEVIRSMLERMVEVLGRSGASDAEYELQRAIKLFRALVLKYETNRRTADRALTALHRAIEEGDAEGMSEEFETLGLCVAPIGNVIVY